MKIKLLFFLLLISLFFHSQVKYFNTFTLINNGKGSDKRDDVKLDISENFLTMHSNTFKFLNAKKTGRNEMYRDSKKGDMVVSQYLTKYYDISLIRYLEFSQEVYLKIIDRNDNSNYLIHLSNKY